MNQLFWSVVVFLLALVVLVLELFIPSAGMLGILGATFVITSIVLAFMSGFSAGMIMLTVSCIAIPIFLFAALKIWPSTPIGRRILIGPIHEDDVLPQTESYVEFKELVGQSGTATTKMLPSGVIILNHRKYDAISEGAPIDAGDTVTVVAVRMNKIVVRKTDTEAPDIDRFADTADPLAQPIDDIFEDD